MFHCVHQLIVDFVCLLFGTGQVCTVGLLVCIHWNNCLLEMENNDKGIEIEPK